MSQEPTRDASSAVLELLAAGAPADRLTSLVDEARHRGADAAELAELERAARLGLSISSRWERHRQRESGLSTLLEAARDLGAVHQPESALVQAIARRARLLLGLDMAYVCFPEEGGLADEGGQLGQGGPAGRDGRGAAQVRVRASDGRIATLDVGLTLPVCQGPGSMAMTDPVPFWTADYLTDERIERSAVVDEVIRAEGLHTVMAVPLNRQTRPFGVLHIAARSVRHFTADEVALMSAYGELAGATVERARLLDRSAALRESGDAHAKMLQLVLSGGDLNEVAEETSKLLDGAVRICGSDGVVLATAGEVPEVEWEHAAAGALDAHGACHPVPLDEDDMWAAPICTGTVDLGTVLVHPNRPLTDNGVQLLGFATQAMAVLLLLENSRAAIAEGQVRDDLLDELLTHPDLSPKKIRTRARRLGVELDGPHVVVVARPEEETPARASVWAASYAYRKSGLKSMRHGTAVFLLPGTDPGAAARALSGELAPLLGHPVTVAASGPVADPAGVRHGYQEAVRCLEAMTALGAVGRAGSAGELGFLGLLLSESHDAEGYIESVLGPLLAYDEQRLSELTQTLEAFFEAGASPTYAARRLHVHPNTVARRLERISELVGHDWQQPGRALEVQLALRLFRIRSHLVGREPEPS
ncbi:helix-turn-helix domain-containing protein [Streptomyces sp. NBC_01236]|uniref:helix-turn-helix domain-containing protein n=1 Tax=Streptomyces sp. NBC_01236 TaxID=2903789 RepID=UPI002E133AD4|nr:helix-turn-helix domain-containing protein [Streptomyces sp. NBC_01236]